MSPKWKTAARILFFLYLAALFLITVFRFGFWMHGLFSGSFRLVPMAIIGEFLQTGDWFRFVYLFFGNIICFLPLGAVLAARRVPFWRGVLAGFGVSFLIEFLQFFFGSGVSDVDDLILNTLGCTAGYPAYFLLKKCFSHKHKKVNKEEGGPMKLDGFGIMVKDMAVMAAFYRDVLGFEIEWDGKDPSVYLKKDGTVFMLYGRGDMEKLVRRPLRYAEEGVCGHFETALSVENFAAVDEAYAKAAANGGTPVLPPETEPWGQRTSYIADPEGNLVEIGSFNP
jgi:glycopeptide antibiotics resistance protein